MMWNWLVTGLASGVTVLLYDGSPFYPDGNVIFDFIDETRMTHFGTSAKVYRCSEKGRTPANEITRPLYLENDPVYWFATCSREL